MRAVDEQVDRVASGSRPSCSSARPRGGSIRSSRRCRRCAASSGSSRSPSSPSSATSRASTIPRQLAAFVGLIPSEYSSGAPRRQGGITKAGNGRARRALIEAAWAYRHPAKVSLHIQQRIDRLPKPLQDLGWKAQVRLCKRFRRLVARGKHPNVAVTAVARELIAFMWAIAKEVPLTGVTRIARPRGRAGAWAPVCSAILDDVKRRRESTLVPRPRQALDGSQYGGTQPTDISRINRRSYWSRSCPAVSSPRTSDTRTFRSHRRTTRVSSRRAIDKPKSYQRAASAAAAQDATSRRRLQADVGLLLDVGWELTGCPEDRDDLRHTVAQAVHDPIRGRHDLADRRVTALGHQAT